MSIIIVSDIFGMTPALQKLSAEIGAAEIIDPYSGKLMEFINESEAYAYFLKNIGLDLYAQILDSRLNNLTGVQTLIGFSIGAAVIWKCAENDSTRGVKSAVCFYGAQIRNYLTVIPNFHINLIFPKHEPHFSVDQLSSQLSHNKNICISKSDYLHGFMNECSVNFNLLGYRTYVKLLQENSRNHQF